MVPSCGLTRLLTDQSDEVRESVVAIGASCLLVFHWRPGGLVALRGPGVVGGGGDTWE